MNKKLWIVGVVAIVAILGFWYFKSDSPSLGAVNVENYVPVIMQEGYNSAKPITLSGASGDITSGDDITVGDDLTVTDDVTISGGALTVTTSGTATSSLIIGCIQTYATSTLTPVKLSATTTPGYPFWVFGTCP